MDTATLLPAAFGVGFVTGLRSMAGPAAVAWGARLGWLKLGGSGFGFLAHPAATVVLTLAMLGEFVGDKLPKTPSRKSPGPFGARIVLGGLGGAALGLGSGTAPVFPAVLGVFGAVAGTLGGYEARVRIPPALKIPDFPYALFEDLVAIGLGLFLVSRVGA